MAKVSDLQVKDKSSSVVRRQAYLLAALLTHREDVMCYRAQVMLTRNQREAPADSSDMGLTLEGQAQTLLTRSQCYL